MQFKKTFLFFLIFISSSIIPIFAQTPCKTIRNKQAIKNYNEAQIIFKTKPKEASDLLEEALRLEPKYYHAYYSLGLLNIQFSERAKEENNLKFVPGYLSTAELYFTKSINVCPQYNNYLAYFYLGQLQYNAANHAKSKENLAIFIEKNKNETQLLDEAKKMQQKSQTYLNLLNNPVPFNPVKVKDICTGADELLPLITPDGSYIFYTRRNMKGGEMQEELTLSKRITPSDSSLELFSKGNPMTSPFNDGRNMGGATITIDNQNFFITICEYQREGYTSMKNCDIYLTQYLNNNWTPLKKLDNPVNTAVFEGQPSITADGKILYFSSNREGGYGGYDIYRALKDNNGNWTIVHNLGPTINTKGDEKTPFIHSDGQTLYFSSNGYTGMGGFDIYYTTLLQNKWTDPKNIGYPINTTNDELGFIVGTNGRNFYFSLRNANNQGDWDIYTSEMPNDAKPQKVILVKGSIDDDNGNDVSNAKVELRNINTNKTTNGFVDETTGNYAVATIVNKTDDRFIMTVKKEGYVYQSKYINPFEKLFEPPTTINVKIAKIQANKPYRLDDVNFDFNSSQLTVPTIAILENLVSFLIENKTLNIEIQGHTDNIGDDDFNLDLSNQRAKAVASYLMKKGISSKRLTYKGFGETTPITTNATEQGRAINRRVEFVIKN